MNLVKETGAGLTTSNAYVDVVDANAFFETHIYASAWAPLGADYQARALIMASRQLDQTWQFNGYKMNPLQAMQWPRMRCPDPDIDSPTAGNLRFFPNSNWLDETKVPQIVKDATCQMALDLLTTNRTADPDDRGIRTIDIFQGVKIEFDKADQRRIVPDSVRVSLMKYGRPLDGAGGTARLVRT